MMPVLEEDIAEEWIYTELSEDPAVQALVDDKIFSWRADERVKPPYIVFDKQADNVVHLLTRKQWIYLEYQVKLITDGESHFDTAGPIVQAIIDRLTNKAEVAVRDIGYIMSAVEVASVRYVEYDDETQTEFRHAGRVIGLEVQAV